MQEEKAKKLEEEGEIKETEEEKAKKEQLDKDEE